MKSMKWLEEKVGNPVKVTNSAKDDSAHKNSLADRHLYGHLIFSLVSTGIDFS